jgi:polysulfide reductase chain C
MLAGWLICAVLGGGLHLLYLGHPSRFWRMMFSAGWKTSWISRGLYFVSLFLVLGAVHLIMVQWASPALGLLIVADILCLLTIVYAGFAMNFVIGISLWNSPLLPVLYLVLGLWGGLGITLLTLLPSKAAALDDLEVWSRIFLLAFIFIVFVYLLSIRYQGTAAKVSVKQIVTGRWAVLFWVMVVSLAMLLPLVVTLTNWIGGLTIPTALLYVVILFELIGDLALRYSILRSGFYSPLIPASEY